MTDLPPSVLILLGFLSMEHETQRLDGGTILHIMDKNGPITSPAEHPR